MTKAKTAPKAKSVPAAKKVAVKSKAKTVKPVLNELCSKNDFSPKDFACDKNGFTTKTAEILYLLVGIEASESIASLDSIKERVLTSQGSDLITNCVTGLASIVSPSFNGTISLQDLNELGEFLENFDLSDIASKKTPLIFEVQNPTMWREQQDKRVSDFLCGCVAVNIVNMLGRVIHYVGAGDISKTERETRLLKLLNLPIETITSLPPADSVLDTIDVYRAPSWSTEPAQWKLIEAQVQATVVALFTCALVTNLAFTNKQTALRDVRNHFVMYTGMLANLLGLGFDCESYYVSEPETGSSNLVDDVTNKLVEVSDYFCARLPSPELRF